MKGKPINLEGYPNNEIFAKYSFIRELDCKGDLDIPKGQGSVSMYVTPW